MLIYKDSWHVVVFIRITWAVMGSTSLRKTKSWLKTFLRTSVCLIKSNILKCIFLIIFSFTYYFNMKYINRYMGVCNCFTCRKNTYIFNIMVELSTKTVSGRKGVCRLFKEFLHWNAWGHTEATKVFYEMLFRQESFRELAADRFSQSLDRRISHSALSRV